jgi:hypothetical protein
MSDSYEQAKGDRNWLERLGEKIPGYRGYQDRELRRDVDKLQREHLSLALARAKANLRECARTYVDAGKIGTLAAFDRVDRKLDGLSQAIRFADYGASGIFDAVKIGEAELEKLHRFDLLLAEEGESLASAIATVPAAGGADPAAALDEVAARVRALEEKWAGREDAMTAGRV